MTTPEDLEELKKRFKDATMRAYQAGALDERRMKSMVLAFEARALEGGQDPATVIDVYEDTPEGWTNYLGCVVAQLLDALEYQRIFDALRRDDDDWP
jgi:hypothetical protein